MGLGKGDCCGWPLKGEKGGGGKGVLALAWPVGVCTMLAFGVDDAAALLSPLVGVYGALLALAPQ